MKKFRKVLYTVLTIVAAAIYFAEELGEIFSQVEKEKQEVAQIVSKWQEETGVKVKDAADASKKAVKEVAAKAEKVAGKQKDEAGEKEASGNTARKSTGSAAGKQNAPARLEIPRMQKDAPSQILEYTGHTLSYNSKTRLPNWVAYELTRREAQGDNPRKDKFARDPKANGPQGDKEDYRNSGWDRGHMAPAGDMKWSTRAMDESYYFTNICPQNHELNTGDWKELEEKCRNWAEKLGSIHIVCGPIITDNTHGTLGANKIVIPDKFFKVLLTQKDGKWQGAGFIFHNPPKRNSRLSTKPPVNRPLEEYLVTIDEVEAITGLDFFHKLPDSVEKEVEQQKSLF
ncbi:MAG: DNA/RNA non-specific endonuclease [Bacteroidales bacterium]|nr:DNA/RNA non-specific endonuclease [Bacteroidales bacterium]